MAKTPPSCLAGFRCVVRPSPEAGAASTIDFALACARCSSDSFRLFGFPLEAPDPSPYYGVQPGQRFFRPPHRLDCTRCGYGALLFDVRTQGYDGVLNGGGPYESGTSDENAVPGEFRIVVGVTYNIALDELAELADEAGVGTADLFDWIKIVGISPHDGKEVRFSYECA